MNATQLFPNTTLVSSSGLFIVSFPSMYRKLSYGIQILLLYEYSYFIAVSERCVGERVVCMSLDLDDAIVEDWLIIDIENVGHCQTFRTANPNNFKNSTFDALSFFFFFLMGD